MNSEQPSTWVQGTLKDNAPVHIYQGNIIARFATIQTNIGEQTLRVLDEGVTLACAPISGELMVGHTYSFLLAILVNGVQRMVHGDRPPAFKIEPPPSPGPATWYGQLVTLEGKSPVYPYMAAVPRLEELDWAIVRTPVGSMVINPDEFDRSSVHPGDAIRWKTLRLSLLAAWEPQ